MNNYLFLIWAVLQHPIWHLNVMKEEQLVVNVFGDEYKKYCEKTGRFFPKIRVSHNINGLHDNC